MAKPNESPPTDTPTRVVEMVVNLDDVTGEQAGAMIAGLIDRGALDAWATPITMKKGRPAIMLSALVQEDDRAALAEQMLELTGSFGLRYRDWDRLVLERTFHDRPSRLGQVRLKAGALAGETVTVKPEFDDVLRLSQAAGVGITEAHRVASAAADALLTELRSGKAGGDDHTAQGGQV